MKSGMRRRCGTFVISAWTVVGVWAAAETARPESPVSQAAQAPTQPQPSAARCRVEGHVTSGNLPLPGASVVVQVGDAVKAATSTDADGKFTIAFSPNATYHLAAELTAFTRAERDVTLGAPPCDTTVDFALSLRPRGEAAVAGPAAATRAGRGETAPEPTQPAAAGNGIRRRAGTGTGRRACRSASSRQPGSRRCGCRGRRPRCATLSDA